MFEANHFYNLLFCWTPKNKQTNAKRHIASVWGFSDLKDNFYLLDICHWC